MQNDDKDQNNPDKKAQPEEDDLSYLGLNDPSGTDRLEQAINGWNEAEILKQKRQKLRELSITSTSEVFKPFKEYIYSEKPDQNKDNSGNADITEEDKACSEKLMEILLRNPVDQDQIRLLIGSREPAEFVDKMNRTLAYRNAGLRIRLTASSIIQAISAEP